MAAKNSAKLRAQQEKSGAKTKHYVAALKAENLKLQKQIARYQAQEVTLENRITALENEVKRAKPPQVNIRVVGVKPKPNPSQGQ